MALRLLHFLARTQMKELGNEWLLHIRHSCSQHTYTSYRKVLWRLVDFAPKEYENLTPEHLERFLDSQGILTNSQNTFLTAIKAFCRYCEEIHGLPNPARKVKFLKKQPSQQRIITRKELDKVLTVCRDGEASMLLFLANTGLRVSELQSLTEQNLSPDGQLLYITGKGGKQRSVPLNSIARSHLPTTINFSKNHQGPRTIYNICQRLSKKAGLSKPFGPHALRHHFATEMSKKKVSLCLLSRLLGHSSTAVTEAVYIHLNDSDLIGACDCLDE